MLTHEVVALLPWACLPLLALTVLYVTRVVELCERKDFHFRATQMRWGFATGGGFLCAFVLFAALLHT